MDVAQLPTNACHKQTSDHSPPHQGKIGTMNDQQNHELRLTAIQSLATALLASQQITAKAGQGPTGQRSNS
eukprot:15451024-Alexandrium_andersonii.AAC.1